MFAEEATRGVVSRVRKESIPFRHTETKYGAMMELVSTDMRPATSVLEHQCPQCRAAIALSDTERTFHCPRCHIDLTVYFPEYACYYLSPHPSCQSPCFYTPYWRFRGQRLVLSPHDVRTHMIDYTTVASQYPGFPPTLGIRPQTMALRFVESQEWNMYLSLSYGYDEFIAHLQDTSFISDKIALINSDKDPLLIEASSNMFQMFISESVNLIYSPYFIRNDTLFDGVTNAPIGPFPQTGQLPLENSLDKGVRYWANICPECNWVLRTQRESFLLICDHCTSTWYITKQGFHKYACFSLYPERRADVWFPFRCLKIQVQGIPLTTVADFERLCMSTGPVRKEMELQNFMFWTPAFKCAPELFCRLSKTLLHTQPMLKPLHPDLLKSTLYPINLHETDTLQSMPFLLAKSCRNNKSLLYQLKTASYACKAQTLVYIPFVKNCGEYVQPDLNLSIPAKAVHTLES